MFEDLFTYPKVLARQRMAPAAADRERYLAHCADHGIARITLARIAQELLVGIPSPWATFQKSGGV
jgi:hypothetical protein